MSKSSIIFINHYASIPKFPGPTRNFDFAATLVALDWQVTLFSCRFNHYLRSYLPNPPARESGVRLNWVWSTAYRGNSIQRELNIVVFSFFSFWKGLFTGGDVIVAVTPPLESAWSAWLLSRIKRVPFVLDVEDLWPDSLISMGFRNKVVIGLLRLLERFLYQHADHILTVAQEMKEYLLRQGVPEAKVTLIPLGANIPSDRQNRTAIRGRYGWQDDQVIAVYVGAHGPANALETLLKAAEDLTGFEQVKIVLFGDGSAKPGLKEKLAALNLTNISLEDPVTPEMVPDILRAAEIGIASLKDNDTFKTVRPNKLYEYMAVGLPIVCCIDGEAKRFVEEVGAGVAVTPEDHQGLAIALKKLTQNAELRHEMGENGRRFVALEGDRVKLAKVMGQTLKKVITG